jgi:hypothetical protein
MEKPTYAVTVTFDLISASNPLEASKKVSEMLKKVSHELIYDVENELTGQKYTVDLSESDKDAVSPNNEH